MLLTLSLLLFGSLFLDFACIGLAHASETDFDTSIPASPVIFSERDVMPGFEQDMLDSYSPSLLNPAVSADAADKEDSDASADHVTTDFDKNLLTSSKIISGSEKMVSEESGQALSRDAIAIDWESFKRSLQPLKIGSDQSFLSEAAQQHGENDAFVSSVNFDSSASDQDKGYAFRQQSKVEPTSLHNLLQHIAGFQANYPLVFYSIIFFIAFFVIVKSIMLLALRLRQQ